MHETNKVTEQILRNVAKGVKIVNFLATEGPNRGMGDPIRVIQLSPALHG